MSCGIIGNRLVFEEVAMPKKKENEFSSVGGKIKKARLEKGVPLNFVANETGFSTEYLEKVESDETMPPVGTILQIARALDIDSALLLKEQESELTNRISASTKRTEQRPTSTSHTLPQPWAFARVDQQALP